MSEANMKSKLLHSFMKIVDVADLDDIPKIMEMSTNICANSVGCGLMRKLDEDCDCKHCRDNCREAICVILKELGEQIRESIDVNLIAHGKNPLYGPTIHNAQLAEEIRHEIKKAEDGS